MAPLYRTAPVSPIPQADFLNTVVVAPLSAAEGAAARRPPEILARLKALERRAGRRPGERFGPRPLDLDLLLYGDLVLPDPAAGATADTGDEGPGSFPDPILPHPRMRRRRFVLAPLYDLRPELRLPPDGATVGDLLAALGSEQAIEKIGWRAAGAAI